jgi:tRNA(Ile)-lysidine synthase
VRLTTQAPGFPALDAHLMPAAPWPIAVAYSGGGDSHALALAAAAWAEARGRRVILLYVDHHLQPQSASWAALAEATATRLGAGFRRLDWLGEKPLTGLPAAARSARHRLIARAAQEAGARVILMGHTADDVAEARLMQARGGSVPEPRPWAPSPVWPEGAGLFLLRPLLGCRRADLRDWLRSAGESWIDDPANEDERRARTRARKALAAGEPPPPGPPAAQEGVAQLAQLAAHPLGEIVWRRPDFIAAPSAAQARALSVACLCVGGGARPPRGDALRRLIAQLEAGQAFASTLAGARIELLGDEVRLCREPGEAGRGGLAHARLNVGTPLVWDGRWRLTSSAAAGGVMRLAGQGGRLAPATQRRLGHLRPPVRWGLPVVSLGEALVCPPLEPEAGIEAVSLTRPRFKAACGLVKDEADLVARGG